MGLGLLQEVDDVAVLVRPLGQTVVAALLRGSGRSHGGEEDAGKEQSASHGASFLAVIFNGAASGPAFQKAILMRPSGSDRTCEGTLQPVSS